MEIKIIQHPNDMLRHVSKEVKLPVSEEDKQLLNEMYAWLREHKDECFGITANQVGVLKRMCVIRFQNGNSLVNYKLVNPKIIGHSAKKQCIPEGCMSVAEKHEEGVERWATVKVMGFDVISNKQVVVDATGTLARIFQHEIDHMDGILYIDKLVKKEA